MRIAPQVKAAILRGAERLPNSVALPMLSLQRSGGLVYGRAYRHYRRFLEQHRPGYDSTAHLLRIASDALQTVPYYRERYRGHRIGSLAELLGTVAPIARDDVANAPEAFIADTIDREKYDVCATGGTSGRPLQLLAPKDRYVVELATMHSLWANAGFDFHARAVIRNHRVHPQGFRTNPLTREVIFDGYRIDPDSLREVLRVVRALRIRFVHCYPSTAYELARLVEREGLDHDGLVFLSGSENIFDYQRDLIVNRLGIRFYNWYGHSEKLILGGYCAGSDTYHLEPTYGYPELLDERGRAVTEPRAVGELVGSTLHNPGMPLLRYRTGDVAEYVGDHCMVCGRRLLVVKNIQGRWSGERVYRRDGSFVTTTALNLHDELFRVIRGLQYVQEQRGELDVLLVKGPTYAERHERELLGQLHAKLGAEMVVSIRYVDQLLRNPNGKFTQLISRVSAGRA